MTFFIYSDKCDGIEAQWNMEVLGGKLPRKWSPFIVKKKSM
jgi:hypothetical protein